MIDILEILTKLSNIVTCFYIFGDYIFSLFVTIINVYMYLCQLRYVLPIGIFKSYHYKNHKIIGKSIFLWHYRPSGKERI